jgi:hypothetical protein
MWGHYSRIREAGQEEGGKIHREVSRFTRGGVWVEAVGLGRRRTTDGS